MEFSQELLREWTRLGVVFVERGIRVAVVLAGAWLVMRVFRKLLENLRRHTTKTMDKRGGATELEMEKRSLTITSVLTKVVATLVWLVAGVMALNELSFNVQPLIGGLGIVGLALGLGAQTLVKDWLGGFFLLIEDQIRIGDSVSINGVNGSVEEINLRTTVLRSENGGVHMIPNGSITQLSNFTREYSYYVFETTIAHGSPVSKALAILRSIGEEMDKDETFAPLILGPLEVMGIDKLSDKGITLRARVKTIPSQQAYVGRELNHRVNDHFDQAGIRFPSPTA